MKETVKFTASMILVLLATAGMVYMVYQIGYQTAKNEQQPVIIYQVDNAGTEMFGKVTAKDVIEGHYYVEVKPYGKFLVTREQYEEIEIGQENNVLKIREAVCSGYVEATVGDSINLAFPNSTTSRGRVGKGVANTVLTGGAQGVVTTGLRIRKLTPRECWRLQGFPDWAFNKAQEVNSNSQLYKQAGNSVTVNVIEAIARKLEETNEQTGSD